MKTEKEERRAKEKLLNVKRPELDEFENKMFSQFLFLQMVNSTEVKKSLPKINYQ